MNPIRLSLVVGSLLLSGALTGSRLFAGEPARVAGASWLGFVPNRGQTDACVLFHGSTRDAGVWFTREGVTFASGARRYVTAMRLVGAAPSSVDGRGPRPGRASFLRGADASRRPTGLPLFSEVVYGSAWPGVDVVFRVEGQRVKCDFVLHPGARLAAVALEWAGVDSLTLDAEGNVRMATPSGSILDERPTAYQDTPTGRSPVEVAYDLRGPRSYGFRLGRFDAHRPLVIDPALTFSGFLGGSGAEFGPSVARDAAGNVYVAGSTSSVDFPTTTGAYADAYQGGAWDVFVAKLDPAGTRLEYATYVGGDGFEFGEALAVDDGGSAYVTGRTGSNDFPTTPGAYDSALGGTGDAFLVRLAPSGASLLYSTYLGGSASFEFGAGVVADGTGGAVLTGATNSTDFPTTSGAYDRSFNGGTQDAYLARIDTTATGAASLAYSTFLGGGAGNGSGGEAGNSVEIDAAGNVVVAGFTDSTDFPTTEGAYSRTYTGDPATTWDLFVTKVHASGSALVWSTYLGGSGSEFTAALALDASGAAYVAARTSSTDFPTTAGAHDRVLTGPMDACVTKLSSTGSALLWSTYLGGSSTDIGFDVDLGPEGDPVVVGFTTSSDFPTSADAFDATAPGGGDAFLTRLTASSSSLVYSTYLGGSAQDAAQGVSADPQGSVVVVGVTGSSDFPTTAGAFDTTFAGGTAAQPFDVFVARLELTTTGRLDALADQVQALVDSGALTDKQAKQMLKDLAQAIDQLGKGKPDQAIHKVEAFIGEVEDLVDAGVLDPDVGDALIDAANEVIALLS